MVEPEDASCSVANWSNFINQQLYFANVFTVDSGYRGLREGLTYFHKIRPVCQVVNFYYEMSCRAFRSFMEFISRKGSWLTKVDNKNRDLEGITNLWIIGMPIAGFLEVAGDYESLFFNLLTFELHKGGILVRCMVTLQNNYSYIRAIPMILLWT